MWPRQDVERVGRRSISGDLPQYMMYLSDRCIVKAAARLLPHLELPRAKLQVCPHAQPVVHTVYPTLPTLHTTATTSAACPPRCGAALVGGIDIHSSAREAALI